MVSTLLLIIIYLSFISLGLPDALLGSAWPSMFGALGVPVSYAGIISMIIASGTVVSSVLGEKTVRRFGTGKTTAISVLMTAVALFGFSISGSFISLCIYAVPLGIGAGAVDAALNNYVAVKYKAKHMSWLHCFWGIGASAGPLVMSMFLLYKSSWHLGYRTISIIQFILVFVLFISLPLWAKANGVAAQTETISHLPLSFRQTLMLPGAKSAFVSFFCYCAMEATVGLWGSSYLTIIKGIKPETAARWISLYYIGITAGRFLSGFMTIKFSNRQMIRLGQFVLFLGIIFSLLPFGRVSLMGGFFVMGLGLAPIFPSLLHETPRNFSSEHSQAIMGVQMACAYIGTTLMPPLFGAIASKISYTLFPFYLGAILLLMIFMVESLNKKVDFARLQKDKLINPNEIMDILVESNN